MRASIVVLVSVLSTLVVGGGGAYLALKPKPPADDPTETTRVHLRELCQQLRSAGSDNRCFREQAEAWSKAEYCDLINAEPGRANEERVQCLTAVGQATGDAELCKRAGSSGYARNCLTELAHHLEKPELCSRLDAAVDRERCLVRLAEGMQDPSICAKIEAGHERDRCLSASVSPVGASVARCAQIEDVFLRRQCSSRPIPGDAASCLALPVDVRGACLVASHAPIDDLATACSGSSACLTELVSVVGAAACALIPDEQAFDRPGCFQRFVEQSMNGGQKTWIRDSVCENQPSALARDECFAALARVPGRSGACARVMDAAKRRGCLVNAGLVDPAACRLLSDRADAAHCVSSSNFQTSDANICDLLDEKDRKRCRQRVDNYVESEVRRGH